MGYNSASVNYISGSADGYKALSARHVTIGNKATYLLVKGMPTTGKNMAYVMSNFPSPPLSRGPCLGPFPCKRDLSPWLVFHPKGMGKLAGLSLGLLGCCASWEVVASSDSWRLGLLGSHASWRLGPCAGASDPDGSSNLKLLNPKMSSDPDGSPSPHRVICRRQFIWGTQQRG